MYYYFILLLIVFLIVWSIFGYDGVKDVHDNRFTIPRTIIVPDLFSISLDLGISQSSNILREYNPSNKRRDHEELWRENRNLVGLGPPFSHFRVR